MNKDIDKIMEDEVGVRIFEYMKSLNKLDELGKEFHYLCEEECNVGLS